MKLAIGMLNNVFPLHTKTQNYHLKYLNVYIRCRNVNKISLTKVCTYDDEYYHIENRV